MCWDWPCSAICAPPVPSASPVRMTRYPARSVKVAFMPASRAQRTLSPCYAGQLLATWSGTATTGLRSPLKIWVDSHVAHLSRHLASSLRLRGKISVTVPWWEPSIAFWFARLAQKFVAQFVYLSGRRKVHACAADFKATVRFLKEILLVFHGGLPRFIPWLPGRNRGDIGLFSLFPV